MGEGHDKISPYVLNSKRSIVGRKVWILEGAGNHDEMEASVIDFHLATGEIAGVQTDDGTRFCNGQSFVDSTVLRVVHFYNRTVEVNAGIPAGDRPVLCRKEEDRGFPGLHREELGVVEDSPGRSRWRCAVHRGRDRYYERHNCARAIIECRKAGSVV